jgi:recombination protein RecA
MSSAIALREQIESMLAMRIPAALSVPPRNSPELLPTGVVEVDALLGGGLPLGGVTEIVGPAYSGRSTLVFSFLASLTGQGATAAYVDVSDTFDPISAAAIGIDLGRLLWVRAGGPEDTRFRGVSSKNAQPLKMKTLKKNFNCGHGGSHPRTEIRGMDQAVERLFKSKPNPEKVEIFQNSPLQEFLGKDDPGKKSAAAEKSPDPQPRLFHGRHLAGKERWDRLDRALRATDLLLNTGGFRAIVVDMGDIEPEVARRVPLASWYRFRLQAEKSQAILILVAQTACAHSCASVVLHCREAEARWQHAGRDNNDAPSGLPLLTGFRYKISADRKRGSAQESFHSGKKKSASVTSWNGTTQWAR